MTWKNIDINAQNIKTDTGKATLITCPHNSRYDGYSFWHPSKLVRDGRNSYSVSIGYTDDFTFKLKKYGKGKYNKHDIINEIEISVEDFEEMFRVSNDNISSPKEKNPFETHKPQKYEVTEIETDEELKDDD